jgi:predicted small integral membrane protein
MMMRISKSLLLLALAFHYALLVLNNTNDYHSNLNFVQHVLSMDTTFPGNNGMWRQVRSPAIWMAFFIGIVLWETTTCALLLFASFRLLKNLRAPAAAFNAAKKTAVAGLTLSLLMWLTAFLSIGAEWFLMWQSKTWSGQQAAFHMFAVVGIITLYVLMPDTETQP